MREMLAGSVRPDTANPKDRTIDVLWYSGAAVRRYNFWADEEYMLSFSMEPDAVKLGRLQTGAPFLNAHQDWKLTDQIGVVEKAWLSEGRGYATVRFSDRDDVTPIWNDIKGGIIQNVSMGATINQRKDVTPKGEKMRHYLATDWEPGEISAVPIGADPEAGFLSFQSRDEYQRFAATKLTGAAGQSPDPNKIRLKIALSKGLSLR
jgi:hypothetical protein